jgi:hypothetical protein
MPVSQERIGISVSSFARTGLPVTEIADAAPLAGIP